MRSFTAFNIRILCICYPLSSSITYTLNVFCGLKYKIGHGYGWMIIRCRWIFIERVNRCCRYLTKKLKFYVFCINWFKNYSAMCVIDLKDGFCVNGSSFLSCQMVFPQEGFSFLFFSIWIYLIKKIFILSIFDNMKNLHVIIYIFGDKIWF